MKSPFQIFADRVTLPRDLQSRLKILLDSGVADQLMDQEERRSIAARTSLVEKIAQITKAYAANVGLPTKNKLDAQRVYVTSVSAMQLAHKDWMAAESEMYAFEYPVQAQINAAERELLESSDPRLSEFLALLARKDGEARNKIQHRSVVERTRLVSQIKHHNNVDVIESARAVLLTCMNRCREMQMQPFSSAEISQELAAMCASMGEVLAPLGLQAPVINEDGEVVDPSASVPSSIFGTSS